MKLYRKIATTVCAAALGMLALTSCEGGDLYGLNAPDWLSAKADSIAAAKAANQGGDEEIEGLHEDVYTVGATDYSTGWWAVFSKYYQIPEGAKWVAQFNLNINPAATNTYKNFVLIITNDEDRGAADYKEYGAIRYDFQPSGNSEWGDYIDRSLATSTLEFQTDTDAGVDKLGGKVTLTVDRSEGGLLVTMNNGTVVKTYTQKSPLVNLNADPSNKEIRCFLVPEGSYINFLGSTIEPIGGFTSAEDKEPVALELSGVPTEVLVGTTLEEAMANVTGKVTFANLPAPKEVTAEDLIFESVPSMDEIGQKILVVMYNKTFKGSLATKPVIAVKTFNVVNELSAFTETVVVPSPAVLGAEDNSSGWWSEHTQNIKVAPKETKVVNFTNYTSGANNWNNFVIVLNKADLAEYAVVRADNYGWGDGYAACKPVGGFGSDEEWAAWRAAMNGAKVTAYITNNGDGTANIKAVMYGTDGNVYTQEYIGINTVDPDDMYFRFTIDGCHLVFDKELGAADCSTGWWQVFTQNVKVDAHQVCTVNFTNYGSGANNWNNFVLIMNKENVATEYAVVRADNYGWGDGYAACKPVMEEGRNWDVWRAAMIGAKVTLTINNKGDGTVDVTAAMQGNDGNVYTQQYLGINTIDPDDFYFRFTVDSSYLVFE